MDQRLSACVDLFAKVRDVKLDDVRLSAEVIIPHPIEDLSLAEYAPRVTYQVPEQFKLCRRQLDQRTVPANLAGILVHGQIADHEQAFAGGPRDVCPAQQPAQPGEHLFQAERLGDVVVTARGDTGDPVFDRVAGGKEEHAHPWASRANPAQHLKPVEVGQHDVKDDRIRLELSRGADSGAAIAGGLYLPALVAEDAGQDLRQGRFVIDHEDADGAPVGAQ